MSDYILEARNLSRSFGHVRALVNASLTLKAGEVLALIGDNGAGKSTLVSAMSGTLAIDSGEILVDGGKVEFRSPADAAAAGIETVYQDLALAPSLNAVSNLYLGRERKRGGVLGMLGFMDEPGMSKVTQAALNDLGATVRSLVLPVGSMSGGQRQAIALARVLAFASRIVFLDEPTAALGVTQTAGVLDMIRKIRDQGIGVVLITHSMPHVMEVADRATVLYRGADVATVDTKKTTMEELVGLMTGALGRRAA
ncbi:ABC-type sugar transport system, ATPase component [Rhizobium leguminosarum bv. trifolii WSM2012]|nr:ABC-type sugar transport system, ATPase component [Rhizobium leguminosarum bv. trifolii WSM2012]EJC76920.1 ABC-type sugar transport system, ATPase component [Rhizobium leguminosarum bv. trifolii WSM2012]